MNTLVFMHLQLLNSISFFHAFDKCDNITYVKLQQFMHLLYVPVRRVYKESSKQHNFIVLLSFQLLL